VHIGTPRPATFREGVPGGSAGLQRVLRGGRTPLGALPRTPRHPTSQGRCPWTPPGDQSPGPHPAPHDLVGGPPFDRLRTGFTTPALSAPDDGRHASRSTPNGPPGDTYGALHRADPAWPGRVWDGRIAAMRRNRSGWWPTERSVGWTSTSDTIASGSGARIRDQGSERHGDCWWAAVGRGSERLLRASRNEARWRGARYRTARDAGLQPARQRGG